MRRKVFDKKWSYFVISITLCACMLVGILPVSAIPPNTVLPLPHVIGETAPPTVFLGEKNVAIDPFLLTNQVAFFRVSSNVPDSPPVKLNSIDNFDTATHREFNQDTLGSWYVWDGTTRGIEVFKLVQPNMSVLVRYPVICDNKDRTGAIVMNSQDLEFRTSIDQLVFARGLVPFFPPSTSPPPTPIVYDINLADATNDYPMIATGLNLIGQRLNNNPAFIGPWDTNALDARGQYITPPGVYRFNVTCQINGLTVASPVNTVTLVKPSVDVTVSPASVQRGTKATVTISGEPATDYYFGIIECPLRMTGALCDRPPWIVRGSEINGTLTFDMKGSEPLVPNCCGGLPFSTVVPPVTPPDGPYYARVTTDCNGVASFLVDSDTNTWKLNGNAEYTLHVQKVAPEIDGTTLYDQTTLTLTKGEVTIGFYDASDATQAPITEAFLGDLIGIKGINTENKVTYLYMTGPCQPECGGSLLPNPYPYGLLGPGPDPVDVIGGSWNFVTPGFVPAHTWWDTSVLPINPGTYTIYALTSWDTPCPGNVAGCPASITCGGGVCTLLNCPNCLVYAVGTITLKEPTLDASVKDIERCCCPAYPCGSTIDSQLIRVVGNSTGNTPNVDLYTGLFTKDVNVWLFGQGKVGDRKFLNWKQPIPCDGKFNFTIPLEKWNTTLCSLDAGTYDLIIQTHGYNQQYDVVYEDDILGTTLSGGVPVEQNKRWIVTTYPVNAWQDQFTTTPPPDLPDYAKLVQVEGPGYKLGTEALNGLIRGLENPEIDDRYVHVQFTINSKSCLAGTDFEADRTYGNSPLNVQFTDVSAGSPTSWLWNFGDGTPESKDQNPIHTYTKVGRYTVSLTTNGDDKNKQVKNDLIRVAEGPTAAFNTVPADVIVGTQVQFIDLSTGNPSSWAWNFGDGGTLSLQSPVYVYTRPGSYTVQLTVSDLNGISQTVSKVIVVKGGQTSVKAEFSTTMEGPATAQFTDQSTGFGIISWLWNFGDEKTSSEQNPKHTYLKEGTYPVSLTVSNGDFTNTTTKTVGIR